MNMQDEKQIDSLTGRDAPFQPKLARRTGVDVTCIHFPKKPWSPGEGEGRAEGGVLDDRTCVRTLWMCVCARRRIGNWGMFVLHDNEMEAEDSEKESLRVCEKSGKV